MSVKGNQYMTPTSQDTGRGPSSSIWGDCPIADLINWEGGGIGTFGYYCQDDFVTLPSPSNVTPAIGTLGQWAFWGAAGTTILDGVEEGGVALINGTTANKSCILTSNAGSFRFIGGSTGFAYTGSKFWMEFRIALGSVAASQQGVFIGLADNTSSQINSSDTTVIASGGNTLTTTKNLFGFFNRTTTSPADWSVVFQPAAGTAVYPTGLTTIVNDVTGANEVAYAASTDKGHGTNFVKIGMVFDPTGDRPSIFAPATPPAGQTAGTLYRPLVQFYVNGQLHPKFLSPNILQASTFPVNTLFAPVINYMNIAGATAPVYLDWVRFAQLGSF
jgi:hypothetical protein